MAIHRNEGFFFLWDSKSCPKAQKNTLLIAGDKSKVIYQVLQLTLALSTFNWYYILTQVLSVTKSSIT